MIFSSEEIVFDQEYLMFDNLNINKTASRVLESLKHYLYKFS